MAFGAGRAAGLPLPVPPQPPTVGAFVTGTHNPSFGSINLWSTKNMDCVPKMIFFHTKYEPLLILMEKKREREESREQGHN